MLNHCANPKCAIPFRYFKDGKVFRLGSDCAADLRVEKTPTGAPVEHFWLCGTCCQRFTLRLAQPAGVRLVAKHSRNGGRRGVPWGENEQVEAVA